MEKREKLLRPGEVCTLFGVERHTLSRWVKKGLLHRLTLPGGGYRYKAEEVYKFLQTINN